MHRLPLGGEAPGRIGQQRHRREPGRRRQRAHAMMTDVLGKQIHAGIASVPDFIENQRADRVRVVAVLGSARQAALERFSNALAFQAQ